MRRLIIAALMLVAAPAFAQVPPTLQPNTVLGRLGATPGPAQQIPFTTLSSQLSISATPPSGPPGAIQFNLSGVFGGLTLNANTLVGATAPNTPAAITINNCNGGANALTWTAGSGFGCNTITAVAPVSSVFGRTGAVVKNVGDYLFSDIGGTATATQLPITGTGGSPNKVASIGAGTTLTASSCAQWDSNLNLVSTACGGAVQIGTTPITGGSIGNVLIHGTGNIVQEYAPSATGGTPNRFVTVDNSTTISAGCATWAANGSLTTTGVACGSGGGGGTPGTPVNAVQFNTGPGTFTGSAKFLYNDTTPVLTIGAAGSAGQLALVGGTSGTATIVPPATGGGTLTLPPGTDTLDSAASTTTFTNKTFDTAGTGNSFLINGVAATANTGTGAVVRATSPTLVTPTLGAATATSINKVTLTQPATGATYTIADGKTVTQNNTLTYSGTDGSTVNLGAGGNVSYTVGSGTAVLGTSAIASGSCATAVTVASASVQATDVIQASFNGDPTGITGYIPVATGMLVIIPYPTSGNVNFKVCNTTAASITPGAITLNWRVTR